MKLTLFTDGLAIRAKLVVDRRVMEQRPKHMRAIVYRGANDLRMEQVPVPRIRSGELLVRVAACGVCPTDIKKIHTGSVSAPRILGHETSGTIVQVGGTVRGFQVGDRVALHHHVPCQSCHYCNHGAYAQCSTYLRTGVTAGFEPAGGGYAEYVRVLPFCLPGVVKIPGKNSFLEGALLEPVNTVLKGVRQLPIQAGDTVWVIGQGPIGLLFTRLLDLAGMRVIVTDPLESRRSWGQRFGAQRVLPSNDPNLLDQLRKATRGRGVDAAVVTVPNDAVLQEAFQGVRGGGSILLFAHTLRGKMTSLDLSQVCMDEKTLLGSYSSDITLQSEVARKVFSRKVDVSALITHRFPLESTAQAIDLAAQIVPDALKVMVVQPWEKPKGS